MTNEDELLRRIAEVCHQIFLETGMYGRTFGVSRGKEEVSRVLLNQLWNLTYDVIPEEQRRNNR